MEAAAFVRSFVRRVFYRGRHAAAALVSTSRALFCRSPESKACVLYAASRHMARCACDLCWLVLFLRVAAVRCETVLTKTASEAFFFFFVGVECILSQQFPVVTNRDFLHACPLFSFVCFRPSVLSFSFLVCACPPFWSCPPMICLST